METIAAGNEIAIDPVGYAIFLIGYIRAFAIEIMRLDIRCIVEGLEAGRFAHIHQVMGHFRLTIDHHTLAAGQIE